MAARSVPAEVFLARGWEKSPAWLQELAPDRLTQRDGQKPRLRGRRRQEQSSRSFATTRCPWDDAENPLPLASPSESRPKSGRMKTVVLPAYSGSHWMAFHMSA